MEERDHLEDPGVEGYILKEIPNEENESLLTGSM